jgi:hypothetical protein
MSSEKPAPGDTQRSEPLSDTSLQLLLKRMEQPVTVHGFRSAFRDWAGETTALPHDVCEAALAHVRGDQTVKAYARGDLFDKRRKLMEAWARYCTTTAKRKMGDHFVAMRGGARDGPAEN